MPLHLILTAHLPVPWTDRWSAGRSCATPRLCRGCRVVSPRLERTFRSASSRLSKPAPRTRPIRRLCEEVGTCGGRIFFARESPGHTLAGGLNRHDHKSCERCSSRASSSHLFSRSDDSAAWRAFFLRGRAVATAVAMARAASCGTQPASPDNARMPTCQSDGVDLSPANLSCPEVY